MSALHERVAAIPAELAQAELFALGASRGPLTAELPRTFSSPFARQWTLTDEPLLVIELLEYHMFDIRVWKVRGAELPEVERVLAELPRVDPTELAAWLASDDAPTLMRGLRTAVALDEPWSPALEQSLERALTDARAAVRWAAFRVLVVGRWPAGPLVRRILATNGDGPPTSDLLEQLADALEGAEKQTKKKTKKKKTKKKKTKKKAAKKKAAAKKKPAAKKSTKKAVAKKSPAKKATKKTAAKKSPAKKSTKKTAAKKSPAKKTAAKKAPAKKSTQKTAAKKAPAKKTTKKPATKKAVKKRKK